MPIDPKALLNAIHELAVFSRRVEVLAQHLAATIPENARRVLDLGSGDGSVAAAVMRLRPTLAIEGVDVMLRPQSHIPVSRYDGETLPFDTGSFDVVTIVDVLHHTVDPEAILTEAARVAKDAVVIKDHLLEGWLAGPTLRSMDWVGNRGHDVVLPYNYLSEERWDEAFANAGLVKGPWKERLNLYPAPFNLLFDRRLHFVAALEKSAA